MKEIIYFEEIIKKDMKKENYSVVEIYSQNNDMHDEFLDGIMQLLRK